MSKFITHLRVEDVDDGSADRRGSWQLLFPLIYESDLLGGDVITVPPGFITDFASVPRVPIAYLLAGGRGKQAAVIHDYLYTVHPPGITRRIADAIFREALLAMGESSDIAELMWQGVRAGGAKAWNAIGQAQPPEVAAFLEKDREAP